MMRLTTIALHVEPGAPGEVEAGLAWPLAIAEAHAAHVTALVFAAAAASLGAGPDGQDGLEREAATAKLVGRALEARGLRHEVRGRSSFAHGAGEVFCDQMRVSDIGMMAYASGRDPGRRFLATGGIFSSGRPLLLLPPGPAAARPPARAMIAWDATAPAVRAVHGALPLLCAAGSVTVVNVSEEAGFRPGQSGVELAHLLARHGATAEFRAVPRGRGGVSVALREAARDMGAELLVMGALRHAPLHDIVFGSATREVLDAGPALPTLLAA